MLVLFRFGVVSAPDPVPVPRLSEFDAALAGSFAAAEAASDAEE